MPRRPPGVPPGLVDLLVIGAGINGTGIARDAALRGLSVVLVDKGDIASGTTSWSTRLIHGGLRYLEQLDVGLVRESLREREALLHIAAHLVQPLSFFIPIYAGDRRGPISVRAGMMAYDALAPGTLERHSMLDAEAAVEREPGVATEGLRGAAVYYDAQAEFPERLAAENAMSAHDGGAAVLTHHPVERLLIEDGRVLGAELRPPGKPRVEVRARLTINVAGPWVDQVLAGLPGERMIGGTKGSHLVVGDFEGAPAEALYVEAEDGRPYFIVPWNGLHLIGTTDIRFEGDLDAVEASDEEIDYLIEETNRVIPRARLERGDVLYTYAGVRPLPYAPEGDEGSVSRGHLVHDHAPELEGLLSIVGGKLTTFRALAEAAVDAALAKLERPAPDCRTAHEPLPGAQGFEPEAGGGRLERLYGSRAARVRARAEEDPRLAKVFDPVSGATGAELAHALEEELAAGLEDVLLRRTMVGLGPHAGVGPDERAAELAVEALGWEPDRARQELAAYRERVARMHARAAR